jgi:hypothetical protein
MKYVSFLEVKSRGNETRLRRHPLQRGRHLSMIPTVSVMLRNVKRELYPQC